MWRINISAFTWMYPRGNLCTTSNTPKHLCATAGGSTVVPLLNFCYCDKYHVLSCSLPLALFLSCSLVASHSLCVQIKHKAQDTLIRPSVRISLSQSLCTFSSYSVWQSIAPCWNYRAHLNAFLFFFSFLYWLIRALNPIGEWQAGAVTLCSVGLVIERLIARPWV